MTTNNRREPKCVFDYLKLNGKASSKEAPHLISHDETGYMLHKILAEFGPEFGGLMNYEFSSCVSMSKQTKNLWSESTSSTPLLLESSTCWRARAPLARELFIETVQELLVKRPSAQKSVETRFQVSCQGEIDEAFDPFVVMSQLVDPDPINPAFITGLRLPSIEKCGFRTPCAISAVTEPFAATNNQVNVTPKYSFVDLHIGTPAMIIIVLLLILEKTMAQTDYRL